MKSLKQWCSENDRNDLLNEWDYDANSIRGFFPDVIGCNNSKTKVEWICSLGHSYESSAYDRTKRECGCPYCSNHRILVGFNDLAHVAPMVSLEWNYDKNLEKHMEDVANQVKNPHPDSPEKIMFGSARKVFWKCSKGHESFLSPNARRIDKNGNYARCDKCSNEKRATQRRKTRASKYNLAELFPQIVDEWVYSQHGLTPYDVSCRSIEMVHWKCKNGHEFDKRVADRTSSVSGQLILHQCSECIKNQKTSIAEQICYYYIKQVFPDAVNSYKKCGFEIDVFIPSMMIGVEYDGSYTHKKRLERDNYKDCLAKEAGIKLYRFRPAFLKNTTYADRITIEETNQGVINGLKVFFRMVGVKSPHMDIDKDYNQIMEVFHNRIGKSVYNSQIINEWDYEKNTIDPKFISCRESHISVWWKCLKGHPSYPSYPYNRIVRKTKCPICANIDADRKRKQVINVETGEVFDSISLAEIKYGKKGNTSISACCRKKNKTAYGYHWKYYD